MDYSQKGSVFMPGLNQHGPVYNSNYMAGLYNHPFGAQRPHPMGALPALSSGTKLAIVAGILAAGAFKKIPMLYAGIGAFAVWSFFPDSATAAQAALPAGSVSAGTTLTPDQTAAALQASADAASAGLQF